MGGFVGLDLILIWTCYWALLRGVHSVDVTRRWSIMVRWWIIIYTTYVVYVYFRTGQLVGAFIAYCGRFPVPYQVGYVSFPSIFRVDFVCGEADFLEARGV